MMTSNSYAAMLNAKKINNSILVMLRILRIELNEDYNSMQIKTKLEIKDANTYRELD
jgi:hypothetical protein